MLAMWHGITPASSRTRRSDTYKLHGRPTLLSQHIKDLLREALMLHSLTEHNNTIRPVHPIEPRAWSIFLISQSINKRLSDLEAITPLVDPTAARRLHNCTQSRHWRSFMIPSRPVLLRS